MSAQLRTIVHLIRHGDALPDDGTVFRGAAGYDDLGLNAKGLAQAGALARRLAGSLQLRAVLSSPARRAYETAAGIATASGLAVTTDERLREIGLGDESLPSTLEPHERATAIRSRLASLAQIALRDGSWASVADAEPAADVRARIAQAVGDAARAHPGSHVALVSHAGTINAYFAALLGTARDFFFPIGNTSLSSVRIAGDDALVLRLNDTGHLEARTTAR